MGHKSPSIFRMSPDTSTEDVRPSRPSPLPAEEKLVMTTVAACVRTNGRESQYRRNEEQLNPGTRLTHTERERGCTHSLAHERERERGRARTRQTDTHRERQTERDRERQTERDVLQAKRPPPSLPPSPNARTHTPSPPSQARTPPTSQYNIVTSACVMRDLQPRDDRTDIEV